MTPDVAVAVVVAVIVVFGIGILVLFRRVGRAKGLVEMTQASADEATGRARGVEQANERLADGFEASAQNVNKALNHAEFLAEHAEHLASMVETALIAQRLPQLGGAAVASPAGPPESVPAAPRGPGRHRAGPPAPAPVPVPVQQDWPPAGLQIVSDERKTA